MILLLILITVVILGWVAFSSFDSDETWEYDEDESIISTTNTDTNNN